MCVVVVVLLKNTSKYTCVVVVIQSPNTFTMYRYHPSAMGEYESSEKDFFFVVTPSG